MISRENFMFTVGYQGNAAIVDSISKGRYSKLSVEDLMNKGMFKPALCAALYSGDTELLETVLTLYNEYATKKIPAIDELRKVFGVSKAPSEIEKVMMI